jgi:hypothetical protein
MIRTSLASFFTVAILSCLVHAQSASPTLSDLLAQHKYQEALSIATSQLNQKPTDLELLYTAGVADCELGHFDAGIEYVLEAIKTYPNGIRSEYREALERCIIQKHEANNPPKQATAAHAEAQPPHPQLPAGVSYSFVAKEGCRNADDQPESRSVKVVIAFGDDHNLTYSRATGCKSGQVLFGRWQRTGASITIQINVVNPPGQRLYTAQITPDSKLIFIDGVPLL